MKITALLVLKCQPEGSEPTILATASDVSHFGHFQRSSGKEFIVKKYLKKEKREIELKGEFERGGSDSPFLRQKRSKRGHHSYHGCVRPDPSQEPAISHRTGRIDPPGNSDPFFFPLKMPDFSV